jgi:hypothetical protein
MQTRRKSIPTLSLHAFMALVLLSTVGCVGQAWRQAVREDTPAAYYRFMREHSDSQYVDVARERLEFHKLKRSPSLPGFERFRRKYPNSELIEALHPILEKPSFEAALAQGTPAAYRSFLDAFPNGSLAERAEGNAVYVEADGYGGDVAGLERFAMNHPESDFAAEAERTASASAMRDAQQFDRVGLVLELAPSTPEAKRVRQALLDRIEKMTDRLGVEIVRVPSSLDATQAARYPQARLEVSHRETQVQPEVNAGGLERPSVVGVTRVVFREKQGGAIIAKREFSLRVVDKAHVPGTSVLFSAAAPKFWDQFFVPMARWRNDQTIRPPIELSAHVVDVDAVGDRSIVLYENGDFELIGLADPTKPVKLASYRRGEDYKRWSGVKMLGSHVAIYGEEGLELVRFTDAGPVAEMTWDRGEIGRVLALTMIGGQLVTVGAKGMQTVDRASGELRQVMRRVIQGVDAAGEALVFVDGETVYISSLALLAENRVIAQMKLGRTFAPKHVRVLDSAAIVTGPGGALIIDVKNPQAPKAVAKLSTREVGEVFDATRVRGRIFLIGARGAMILNRQLSRVEETIDVGTRHRVAVMGRHLVTANASSLQVVDAAPWAQHGAPPAASTSSPTSLLNGSGF